jgi:hypothetical protein
VAEVRGKFITMACSLLSLSQEAKSEALEIIRDLTGEEWDSLAPEGWYDTSVLQAVFGATQEHCGSVTGLAVIKVMGKQVYPTIARTAGFPSTLETPLDWLEWEGQSFLNDHRGTDVVPRRFLVTEPGHVVVETDPVGYDCILTEGVFEGILDMCHVNPYQVIQKRCVKKGDTICGYDITWGTA